MAALAVGTALTLDRAGPWLRLAADTSWGAALVLDERQKIERHLGSHVEVLDVLDNEMSADDVLFVQRSDAETLAPLFVDLRVLLYPRRVLPLGSERSLLLGDERTRDRMWILECAQASLPTAPTGARFEVAYENAALRVLAVRAAPEPAR